MYYRLSHVQQYMVFYIFWVACIESMYKIVCLRLPRVILHQCGFQKLFYQAQEITTPHAIASTEFLPGRKPSERDTFQHLPVYNVYDWHALTTTNERMAIQKSAHQAMCWYVGLPINQRMWRIYHTYPCKFSCIFLHLLPLYML